MGDIILLPNSPSPSILHQKSPSTQCWIQCPTFVKPFSAGHIILLPHLPILLNITPEISKYPMLNLVPDICYTFFMGSIILLPDLPIPLNIPPEISKCSIFVTIFAASIILSFYYLIHHSPFNCATSTFPMTKAVHNISHKFSVGSICITSFTIVLRHFHNPNP